MNNTNIKGLKQADYLVFLMLVDKCRLNGHCSCSAHLRWAEISEIENLVGIEIKEMENIH